MSSSGKECEQLLQWAAPEVSILADDSSNNRELLAAAVGVAMGLSPKGFRRC